MKYELDVIINFKIFERKKQYFENDASLVGIRVTDILEKYPTATSLLMIVVPQSE